MKNPDFDPYEVLGVPRHAEAAEIREAFRNRSRALHPDSARQGTADDSKSRNAFAQLVEARNLLLDPQKRAAYDRQDDSHAVTDNEVEVAAREFIASMLEQILADEKVDPLTIDIIAKMTNHAKAQLKHIKKDHAKTMKSKEKIKKVGAKLKRKAEKKSSPRFLSAVIEAKLRAEDQRLEGMNNTLKVMARAIELLDDYQFDFDKPAETTSTSGPIVRSAFFYFG